MTKEKPPSTDDNGDVQSTRLASTRLARNPSLWVVIISSGKIWDFSKPIHQKTGYRLTTSAKLKMNCPF